MIRSVYETVQKVCFALPEEEEEVDQEDDNKAVYIILLSKGKNMIKGRGRGKKGLMKIEAK